MWNLFLKIQKYGITPNQCMILFAFNEGVTPSTCEAADMLALFEEGYITKEKSITPQGKKIIVTLDNYFTVNKKKTTKQLLGKSGALNINQYRDIFPKGKLPSGVPARNNIKILTENFRWFFAEYDYSWEEVMKATKMYVNEYQKNNYMYMQNSQYFISKQDKHKVKTSKLADYCDMIRDGIVNEEDHFKEKVV
tara:strand:- start:4037 stop:4618 length:582 start_codon:yes stop_codon:yes gene_type:complete